MGGRRWTGGRSVIDGCWMGCQIWMGGGWVEHGSMTLDGWWMGVGWVSYEPLLSHRRKNFFKSIAHVDVSMEHRKKFVF